MTTEGTRRLLRYEDIDRTNVEGQRQPYPIGDEYGQLVQAIRPVPTFEIVPTFLGASINTAAANTTIVEAPAQGYRIVVWGWNIVLAGTALLFRWESESGGTELTGPMSLPTAGDGMVVDPTYPAPQFKCGSGELLNLELSTTQAVAGNVIYSIEETP